MKEKLIEILGLKADASDAQFIEAVTTLKAAANETAKLDAGEKEIRDIITASGGAVNREGAKQIIADRKTNATNQKKSAKK